MNLKPMDVLIGISTFVAYVSGLMLVLIMFDTPITTGEAVGTEDGTFRAILLVTVVSFVLALNFTFLEYGFMRFDFQREKCKVEGLEELIRWLLYAYLDTVALVCDDDKLRQSGPVRRTLDYYEEVLAGILREHPEAAGSRTEFLSRLDISLEALALMAGAQSRKIERLSGLRTLIRTGIVGDRKVGSMT